MFVDLLIRILTAIAHPVGYILMGLIAGALGHLGITLRTKYTSYRRAHNLRLNARTDQQIRDHLLELRYQTEACRAYVLRGHNSLSYTDGSPINMLSCTHEVMAPGVSSMLQERVGLSVSILPELFYAEDVPYESPRSIQRERLPECWLKVHMFEAGTTTTTSVPIILRGRGNQTIGTLCLDFMNTVEMTEELSRKLINYSNLIGVKLSRNY